MSRIDARQFDENQAAPAKLLSQAATMAWINSLRPFLVAMLAASALYWGHRVLQLQYHNHCRSDIIRVVLYNQSMMCTHISSILNLVELACTHAVRYLTSHILTVLNIVAGGALFGGFGGGAGGGFFQLPNMFRA